MMLVQIKLYLILVFSVSFLWITNLVAAGNDEHEDHEHRSQPVDIRENRISTDYEKHENHDHEDHTDHSGHDHEGKRRNDEEHEQHSGHGHEDANGDHTGHDHGDANEDHTGHDHGGGGHSEHSDEVTLTEGAVKLFKLKIETVLRKKLIPKITAPARVTFNADRIAHVGSSVSGRVKEIRYQIGDRVREGDVLLVVESPELGKLQSEFLQKRIEAQVAEISVEVAKVEYERAQKLIEGKGISQAQFLQAEGKLKVTKGSLLTAKSTVRALESRLKIFGIKATQIEDLINTEEIVLDYNIVAPLSGEIITRKATLGEVVKPDDHALMVIADLATVWVIASVPELKTPVVKVGAAAYYHAEFIGEEDLIGKVTYIAPALDERTRTGQVRIEIPNTNNRLRPGMFGTVMINETRDDMHSSADILSVPKSAVFTVEGGPAVFVPSENEKNTFEKRAVTIGPVLGGNVTVISGLEEGESYVAKGGFILKAELGKEGVAHEH